MGPGTEAAATGGSARASGQEDGVHGLLGLEEIVRLPEYELVAVDERVAYVMHHHAWIIQLLLRERG
jgi:hypothetical protein